MKGHDWRNLPVGEADREAWSAIRDWSRSLGGSYVIEGFDYTQLARQYLGPKVIRAVRMKRNPAQFDEELRLSEAPDVRPTRGRIASVGHRVRRKLGFLRRRVLRGWNGAKAARPDIFLPAVHGRWHRTLAAIKATGLRMEREDAGCRCFPVPDRVAAREFGRWLAAEIHRGLSDWNLELLPEDAALLEVELAGCHAGTQHARQVLAQIDPSMIAVFADNFSPLLDYVLASRQKNKPSVMIQHGLDCEHLVTEDAYATHLALWGQGRAERYRRNSCFQPVQMEMTGNPEYDAFRLPERLDESGDSWLWVSRPHVSTKCTLPSRESAEGLAIFKALLDAVRERPGQKLVIKPHMFDYHWVYTRMLKEQGLGSKVTLSFAPLSTLLKRASCVISEDSTAGMDAMFFGKPIIHAHFSQCPRSMPFVEYGAALAAFTPEELHDSLGRVRSLSTGEKGALVDGQRRFLLDFNGPCDGGAQERLSHFLRQIKKDEAR